MLPLSELLNIANKRSGYKLPPYVRTWQGVYYGLSLHIDGACPAFQDLRYNVRERIYTLNTKQTFPNNYFGADYQFIFDTYLFSRHPKEPEITRQWRMSQYKPFTQAPFQQVIQVITGAIFQDSGYQLSVEDTDDNDYIWGNNFHGKNLINYFVSNFQNICSDPNGVFIVIPKEPRYETTTPKVEPELYFVHSKYILWHSRDEIVFNYGELIWAVNSLGYFRFGKVEGKKEYVHLDEAQGGYYAHMMRKVPVIVAGGMWNAQGFYQSWLQPAKAIADEFVAAKSAEQMVNKEASHPYIIEANTDCPDCVNGQTETPCGCNGDSCNKCMGTGNILTMCGRCHGSGYISRNPGDHLVVPADQMDKQLIQLVNPNVEINKLHADTIKQLKKDMLEALHLHYIDEAQSGVAKDKDMETRYQFILGISDDFFDRLIPESVDAITALRNVRVEGENVMPTSVKKNIVKPTQFQIKTSFDLLNEYKEAVESKIPSYQLGALVEDYVDKQFGGNDVLKKKTWFINQSDKLANIPTTDIAVMLLNGAAEQRDWQYSVALPVMLDKIVRSKSDDWFIRAEYDAIDTLVQAEFNLMKPPIPDNVDFTEERVNA